MSAERVLRLERVLRAPPAVVWDAWTDPAKLPQWFGPKGFSCRTKSIDLRVGGAWVFDMIGPDGTVYPNRHSILSHDPPHRLTYLLDEGEGTEEHASVEVLLHPVEAGTRLVMEMTFPSPEILQAVREFGAETLGYQTLDKLAKVVEAG